MSSSTSASRSSPSHPLLPPFSNLSSRPMAASRAFFIPSIHEPHAFHPYSSLSEGGKGAMWSGFVGLMASAIQNAMHKHDRGPMGVFTRTGGTIATFTAMGFTFPFVRAVSANIREVDDPINSAAGACAAGFIGGVQRRSLPFAVGACVFLGSAFYTMEANGLLLSSMDDDTDAIAKRRATYWKPYNDKPIPTDLPAGASA